MVRFGRCSAICGICWEGAELQKIAVVTGSSSGIGLLTTIELARNGYRVVATMRDLGRSGRLEEAAQKAGVREQIDMRQLDVTNFDAIAGVVDGIVRDHGRIDVLVNNAGFSSAGFVEDTQLARAAPPDGDQLLRRSRHDAKPCCPPCGNSARDTLSRLPP